eukprot:1971465-Pleurochrysis_carterae.AAC.1
MSADVMALQATCTPPFIGSFLDLTSLFHVGSTTSRYSRSGNPLSEPSYRRRGAKVDRDCFVSPVKSALPASTCVMPRLRSQRCTAYIHSWRIVLIR